jgi:hypothetical protein
MNTIIRKTGKKATYFEGDFYLRDASKNWAHPIDFPTVFEAFGQGIKSGNWRSCTAINTPEYVIDQYFGGRKGNLKDLWNKCIELSRITWDDVKANPEAVNSLISEANSHLDNLEKL